MSSLIAVIFQTGPYNSYRCCLVSLYLTTHPLKCINTSLVEGLYLCISCSPFSVEWSNVFTFLVARGPPTPPSWAIVPFKPLRLESPSARGVSLSISSMIRDSFQCSSCRIFSELISWEERLSEPRSKSGLVVVQKLALFGRRMLTSFFRNSLEPPRP
jgi:hypothetical protein